MSHLFRTGQDGKKVKIPHGYTSREGRDGRVVSVPPGGTSRQGRDGILECDFNQVLRAQLNIQVGDPGILRMKQQGEIEIADSLHPGLTSGIPHEQFCQLGREIPIKRQLVLMRNTFAEQGGLAGHRLPGKVLVHARHH